jgi:hypothetical protein
VPLEFSYAETPLAKTLEELVSGGKAPVYVVHFTQLEAAQSAQDFMSTNVCTREEKEAIAQALDGFKFSSPYGPEIKKWLRHGIGLHHAGLLPKYRVLVEQLAQRGLLKVICGTDTLGVGINVPIRTVLFTQLCKFERPEDRHPERARLSPDQRARGRKGFDDVGWVVAQAPAHVIENLQARTKAGRRREEIREAQAAGAELRELGQADLRAPDRRAAGAADEPVSSHARDAAQCAQPPTDGCRAMQELIARCHETPKAKKALTRRGWQLFRALVERKIIEFIPQTADGAKVRVNVALQDDFSMNQTLSLYVHDTLPLMDPQAPDYALVVLTLVESILEDPDIILRKQLDKVKGQAVAEMKMQGIEYNQRMEELEKLEYPKPNRDFIYSTFNAFAARHPWVGQENIRPKSIAREMFEEFRSFADYIKIYELQRAEGLLLRHLSSVYKVLAQTVPDAAKNDTIREMELYLAHDAAADRFQPARGVGENARAELSAARRARRSAPARRRGSRPRHHPRREGFHRRDPQPHLHLPPRPRER